MKFKLILSLILSLLLFNPSYAKWGKGPLKLSKNTMEFVLMYMYGAGNKKYSGNAKRKNDPDMMAISIDGKHSMYYYCPAEFRSTGCLQEGLQRLTILGCEKESNGTPCFLFAKKRRIVWKNGGSKLRIKKKDLKNPNLVAKKIQDAGFYDGDIYKLAGIDTNTGQVDEENNLAGQKDNFDYPSLIAKQNNVHKDNWKDYVAGGTEKYKAWAMAITNTKNDMTFGWEADDTSWNDVIKKTFDRCNKHLKSGTNHPDVSICILYYKGTTPTTDDEKIKTAIKYYNQRAVSNFFDTYPYILNDSNNSLLKKSKITKKTTQSADIVSKLKDLKELLDTGILTKEEFEKAKKKLLN